MVGSGGLCFGLDFLKEKVLAKDRFLRRCSGEFPIPPLGLSVAEVTFSSPLLKCSLCKNFRRQSLLISPYTNHCAGSNSAKSSFLSLLLSAVRMSCLILSSTLTRYWPSSRYFDAMILPNTRKSS